MCNCAGVVVVGGAVKCSIGLHVVAGEDVGGAGFKDEAELAGVLGGGGRGAEPEGGGEDEEGLGGRLDLRGW